MIVVDATILSSLAFHNENSAAADLLHKRDTEWASSILWRSEFLNVVAHYFRKNLITFPETLTLIDYIQKIVGINEHRVSPQAVADLITTSNCSAYACEYVALAKELKTKLITYDKQILENFPDIASKPEDYLAQFP